MYIGVGPGAEVSVILMTIKSKKGKVLLLDQRFCPVL